MIALGDNIYGGSNPSDYESKFERPYKLLLDAGVKFYAVLGNHDSPNERFYKSFNMNGQKYYTYKKSNVRFFALDSNYMNPQQLSWLEKELQNSGSDWKICYFHHPLYSSGAFHGSSTELRLLLEPLFVKYGVQVVFAGHEHVYERVKPQNGIYYFTEGASGELRKGNLRKTDLTAAGYDQDRSFMLVEIAGDELYFQTISRTGLTVDSGVIQRVAKVSGAASWPTVRVGQGVLPGRKVAKAIGDCSMLSVVGEVNLAGTAHAKRSAGNYGEVIREGRIIEVFEMSEGGQSHTGTLSIQALIECGGSPLGF